MRSAFSLLVLSVLILMTTACGNHASFDVNSVKQAPGSEKLELLVEVGCYDSTSSFGADACSDATAEWEVMWLDTAGVPEDAAAREDFIEAHKIGESKGVLETGWENQDDAVATFSAAPDDGIEARVKSGVVTVQSDVHAVREGGSFTFEVTRGASSVSLESTEP